MVDNSIDFNFTDSGIYYCKSAKFQENLSETNPFIKLSLLRGISSQLGNLSFLTTDNQVSCDILDENLKKYSDLVDDKTNANNYAESIQALVKYFKKAECQKWKSGLVADNSFSCIGVEQPDCCKNYHADEESIEVFREAYRNCDKTWFSCVNTPTPIAKQDHQSGEFSSVFESSNTNQKRKNNCSVNEGPDFVKTRKLEECSYENKSSLKVVKDLVVNNPRNQFKNLSGNQELTGDRKPIVNFRTASTELRAQQLRKYGNDKRNFSSNQHEFEPQLKKSLGSRPRPVSSKFVIPVKTDNKMSGDGVGSGGSEEEECDPRLQHIEPKMIEMIRSEIMDTTSPITWDDIAGLQFAKNTIQEIIVWPMLRPDIFTGLRRPPKGILLFGPPGTGKTLIAKCIASQSKSTFFSISASSLTSKWIGDGEKMVRALFTVARVDQPSVVFIDEIDSLLSKRSDSEHESSRRIKTEFLVQLDGATTGEEDRLLIIGATNRPQELDDAARRRLVKRLYIPLPEHQARIEMITRLMSKERNNLTSEQIVELANLTDGYSGADVKILCQEAALGPIRSISFTQIEHITSDQVRSVTMEDFKTALTRVRSSVSPDDLQCYIDWDKTYGSGSF